MKRLILTTVAIAALAPAAFAMTAHDQLLTNGDLAEIKRYVPDADLSNLTYAELAALANALDAADRGSAVGGSIRAILN
ncbi:MAG: hypothetical protein WBC90_08270 [Albidovulum sp.]|jgi:hypothetical protein